MLEIDSDLSSACYHFAVSVCSVANCILTLDRELTTKSELWKTEGILLKN